MKTLLKDFRTRSGLTQDQLAAALCATKAELSRWENGVRKIPATRAAKISEITGIACHELRPDVFPPA